MEKTTQKTPNGGTPPLFTCTEEDIIMKKNSNRQFSTDSNLLSINKLSLIIKKAVL